MSALNDSWTNTCSLKQAVDNVLILIILIHNRVLLLYIQLIIYLIKKWWVYDVFID